MSGISCCNCWNFSKLFAFYSLTSLSDIIETSFQKNTGVLPQCIWQKSLGFQFFPPCSILTFKNFFVIFSTSSFYVCVISRAVRSSTSPLCLWLTRVVLVKNNLQGHRRIRIWDDLLAPRTAILHSFYLVNLFILVFLCAIAWLTSGCIFSYIIPKVISKVDNSHVSKS